VENEEPLLLSRLKGRRAAKFGTTETDDESVAIPFVKAAVPEFQQVSLDDKFASTTFSDFAKLPAVRSDSFAAGINSLPEHTSHH